MLVGTGVGPRVLRPLHELRTVLGQFGWRGWTATVLTAGGSALAIGIPTVLVPNPWYIRMTPTRPQDYAIWVLTALLFGLTIGTYALDRNVRSGGSAVTGGVLSFFAVGCPVCNKLVVLLLGVSGALTWFGPLQLYLGLGALALLGWALLLRVRALTSSCSVFPGGG